MDLISSLPLLFQSILSTLLMVIISGFVAITIGLPIALILYLTGTGQILEKRIIHRILNAIVSIGRSIPFIILMVALIPLTRIIVGTSIGTAAAIVPLAIAAIPYFARLSEGKLQELNHGLFETARAMGCSPWQTIIKIILPESMPGIANACTILFVSLTEYSAMSGAVGGGGLGNMAIQYGYYQFDNFIMFEALIVLVILVFLIQFIGDQITKMISFKRV